MNTLIINDVVIASEDEIAAIDSQIDNNSVQHTNAELTEYLDNLTLQE